MLEIYHDSWNVHALDQSSATPEKSLKQ